MGARKPDTRSKRRRTSSDRLVALDLFSGCGGLTRGLTSAGFDVIAAIENDPDAAATYRANHPAVHLFEKDIRRVSARGLVADLEFDGKAAIDLIAGCPPCQGFTRLTEGSRTRDPRNALVLEFVRFVRSIKPTAFMMENVPGLLTRGKRLFEKMCHRLESAGYDLTWGVLQVADYGVPQLRKRLVLLGGSGFRIELPEPTHSFDGAESGLRPWRTVRNAIGGLPDPPLRSQVVSGAAKPPFVWHFGRDIAPVVQKRLSHALRNGGDRSTLPETLRLACHNRREDGYSDVYGVMSWDLPSPTITSGCTNASKGRFGHPGSARPLTPREAAVLQSFPLSYKFIGSGVESVARQIGNALPARFAAKVAKAAADAIRS